MVEYPLSFFFKIHQILFVSGDYEKINGEVIPYKRIGYNSIYHLIKDIKDISFDRIGDELRMFVKNEKTEQIKRSEVENQKDQRTYGVIMLTLIIIFNHSCLRNDH